MVEEHTPEAYYTLFLTLDRSNGRRMTEAQDTNRRLVFWITIRNSDLWFF